MSDCRESFWSLYAKIAAVAAAAAIVWLAFQAGTATGIVWWKSPAGAALVVTLVGAIAPVTAFIVSWAKLQLEAQKQGHEIVRAKAQQEHEIKIAQTRQEHEIAQAKTKQEHEIAIAKAKQEHDIAEAKTKQEHDITTDYLNRTLSTELPLATRHQLLRFLATSLKDPARLQSWAKAELTRIDSRYEQYTRDVQAQHEAIANARDVGELRLAEAKLKAMTARNEAAAGKPIQPQISIAAIRAGFFTHTDIGEVKLPGADLDGVSLVYSKLAGSDFTGANMRRAELYESDLRMCKFDNADLKEAQLSPSDCRGATFTNADLQGAALTKVRLEGADLTGASLDQKEVRAVYDRATKWPSGFDPIAAECVMVESPAAEPS